MWANPQFPADLVTFTEEILNGKLHFLYSDSSEHRLKSVSSSSIPKLSGTLAFDFFGATCLPNDGIKSYFCNSTSNLSTLSRVTSHFLTTVTLDALYNNSLSHFVIPDALWKNSVTHFVINFCHTLQYQSYFVTNAHFVIDLTVFCLFL